VQLGGCSSPTGASSADRRDDNAPGFSAQFDIAGKAGVLKKGFRNADALRVTDRNDAGFDSAGPWHSIYNVGTMRPHRKRYPVAFQRRKLSCERIK